MANDPSFHVFFCCIAFIVCVESRFAHAKAVCKFSFTVRRQRRLSEIRFVRKMSNQCLPTEDTMFGELAVTHSVLG